MTSFYGSCCGNNNKGALSTPETLLLFSPCVQFPTFSHCSPLLGPANITRSLSGSLQPNCCRSLLNRSGVLIYQLPLPIARNVQCVKGAGLELSQSRSSLQHDDTGQWVLCACTCNQLDDAFVDLDLRKHRSFCVGDGSGVAYK
eukprot:8670736-Pyramimonas_sp.AAC.1